MPEPCACDLAELAALGYYVLTVAPGFVFCHLALRNSHTDSDWPGWIGGWNPSGGFTEREAKAIALDRGGWVWDRGVFRRARRM